MSYWVLKYSVISTVCEIFTSHCFLSRHRLDCWQGGCVNLPSRDCWYLCADCVYLSVWVKIACYYSHFPTHAVVAFRDWVYVWCTQGSPPEIPTHRNLFGGSMTALPSLLSPNSILCRFKSVMISVFHFLKNCVTLKLRKPGVFINTWVAEWKFCGWCTSLVFILRTEFRWSLPPSSL
jgi:hypothetical protein